MKKLQRKRKGFTLIELVVVIVIIAILAAVALLSFGNFTNTAKDTRIKAEHAQMVAAGNMWRATQTDPDVAIPTIAQIEAFMEGTKQPLAGAHKMVGSVLISTLTDKKTELKYDFTAVTPLPTT